ncbi:uncharacterized protein LOC132727236 [Ruditapes philippinarum]|uniref:uncharacterized protein LOC132727236 n=1 Tax=Ruditapes philippinarum TaxID=129788 RepID=UPI00295B32CD|nr:uncharacterized protein LOC132727236 [Ruditapes philippinarum]
MGAIQLQAVNQECSSLKDNFNFIWLYGKRNNIGLVIGGGVYLLCKWFYRKASQSKTVQILIPIQTQKSEEFRTAISTLLSQECPLQRFFVKTRKGIVIGLLIGVYLLRKWFSQAVKNKDKGFCSHIFTFLALWVNGLFKGIVRNNPYECELCEDVGSLLKDSPLIVVCPICSRPEDSIDAAIRKMPGNVKFAVALLHSCSEGSLPIFKTSQKLPKTDKYRHIKFIDIAVDMDAKIHRCQDNEDARIQLESFIKHFNHT